MLSAAGLQTSAAFENVASKLDIFQKRLKEITTVVNENTGSLKNLQTAAKQIDTALSASATGNTKNAAAVNDNSIKIKALSSDLKNLDVSVKQQITNVDKSKTVIENYDKSVVNVTLNLQLNNNVSQTTNILNGQQEAVDKSKKNFDAHKLTMDHLKNPSVRSWSAMVMRL